MKLNPILFAVLALSAGCSSTTTAPAAPDAAVEEDTLATAETGDEDTLVTAEDAFNDSAKADTATADTRPSVDSVAVDVAPDTATECVAGSTGTESCGKCGTRTRTCSTAGAWSTFGACGSEGVCTPGEVSTESGTCTGKDVRTRTCTSSCAWGAWTCVPPKGWVDIASSPLTARSGHTAVWTGTEMLVWGGAGSLTDGAGYSVSTDTWRTLPAVPTGFVGRDSHTAVWTGSKMIVWGGSSSSLRNDGAMYDPAAGTWTLVPAATVSGRFEHTAVWSGTEMIVWGGSTSGFGTLADGAAYNPSTGWRTIAPVPAGFGKRSGHRAVWAGGKMIIFGGFDYFSGFSAPAPGSCAVKTATSYCSDAAAYDPVTNTWVVLTPPTPALDPRHRPSGLATGATASLALFWGGEGNTSGGSLYRNSGALYDTAAGTWKAMTAPTETILPGSKRWGMVGWSNGTEVFFWGGYTSTSTTSATGASYDLAAATWKSLPTLNAPVARALATAVWTGVEAIVWGGSGPRNDGKLYRP